jgi:NAD(P)-dependent dehydrogenase (short-subunit alcohol dehydrogenase family)
MAAKTWLIVGASRGIGLEFVRQILARGDRVIATVRGHGSALEAIVHDAPDRATILMCDVSHEQGINV